jgi:hypothetical protein
MAKSSMKESWEDEGRVVEGGMGGIRDNGVDIGWILSLKASPDVYSSPQTH